MSTCTDRATSRPLRLVRLHRGVRPAAFLLFVFLLHVGMASACVVDDLSAWLTTPTAVGSTAPAAGDDRSPAHNTCSYCACHFAVALPTAPGLLVQLVSGLYVAALPPRVANAPPVPRLRPPIT